MVDFARAADTIEKRRNMGTLSQDEVNDLGGVVTVDPPPLVTFTDKGQQEEGYLVDLDETGPIVGYVFERKNGERFRINQTADLRQKIRPETHAQHYFWITFKGTDASVVKNENEMRVFKVEHTAKPRRLR